MTTPVPAADPPPTSRLRLLRAGALVVLLAAAVTACVPGQSSPAARSGDGEVRTDLDPLTSRLPVLADATGARWTSGTFGSDRAPGPSTYWIDAVVDLPEGDGDRWHEQYGTQPVEMPQLDALAGEVPDGPAESSAALLAALAGEDWSAQEAYLVRSSDQVVLRLVGE